jgi:hypothetical protein
MFAIFFEERHEHIVNQKEAIVGMSNNGGNFMRMEAKVQSVQNAAGARNAKKGLQMSRMIPHHGSDAIAGPQTEFGQRSGEAAGAAIKFVCRRAPESWGASTDNPSSCRA